MQNCKIYFYWCYFVFDFAYFTTACLQKHFRISCNSHYKASITEATKWDFPPFTKSSLAGKISKKSHANDWLCKERIISCLRTNQKIMVIIICGEFCSSRDTRGRGWKFRSTALLKLVKSNWLLPGWFNLTSAACAINLFAFLETYS